MTRKPTGRRVPGRAAIAALIAASVAAAVLAALMAWPHGQHGHAAAGAPPTAAPKTISTGPGWTLIATAKGVTARYAYPGARSDGTIPATWYGAPSALPVIGQRPGWLEVRLQSRPNGSTAWVRSADMAVAATPYRIDIDLAGKRLKLLRQDKKILDAPAAIGTAQDPTPSGSYFVAFFEQAPDPGYGPFVLVTSAHSNSISDWEHSGDALVGIHGPLGGDNLIGTGGAALSHGCIRLHDNDLEQLRQVPAGTPVIIST
jgi:lipoprotein-anchoring transpeptidase ErfK/SrfK